MIKTPALLSTAPARLRALKNAMDRLAGDAIDRLKKIGFSNIMELRGGFEAWANAGNRVDSCDLQSIKPAQVPFTGS